jgi:tetratricopeptide (TPR) repeat protein
VPRPRQALFDLAVGSLFHEAMKLRENLYQTEIYAPKVRDLQKAASGEADDLFRDFEKILNVAGARLSEALDEAEELLEHTRAQFRSLLTDYREEPLIARTLFAEREQVAEVFSDGLDGLLAEIWGDASSGYLAAARSYLESAYFDEAIEALAEAERRSPSGDDVARLAAYAEGMQAYQVGDYQTALARLDAWLDFGPGAEETGFARLALSAIGSVDALVGAADRSAVSAAAAKMSQRIRSLRPEVGSGA